MEVLHQVSLQRSSPLQNCQEKLDFVTYHRYSNDFDAGGTHDNDAVSLNNFHKQSWMCAKPIILPALYFALSGDRHIRQGRALHDNEMAASFIAKTIHLINTNDTLTYPPPFNYGWWRFPIFMKRLIIRGVLAPLPDVMVCLQEGPLVFRNHGMWQTRV